MKDFKINSWKPWSVLISFKKYSPKNTQLTQIRNIFSRLFKRTGRILHYRTSTNTVPYVFFWGSVSVLAYLKKSLRKEFHKYQFRSHFVCLIITDIRC